MTGLYYGTTQATCIDEACYNPLPRRLRRNWSFLHRKRRATFPYALALNAMLTKGQQNHLYTWSLNSGLDGKVFWVHEHSLFTVIYCADAATFVAFKLKVG